MYVYYTAAAAAAVAFHKIMPFFQEDERKNQKNVSYLRTVNSENMFYLTLIYILYYIL